MSVDTGKEENGARMSEIPRPWTKFYNKDKTPESLNYPEGSLYSVVRTTALRYPERIAYEFEGKKTTYGEMIRKIDHLAACLYKLGVRKGDNVFICMPNLPQTVQMFYAVIKCGAVSTMIHPLSSKYEIRNLLNDSQAKVALIFDGIWENFVPIKEETGLQTLIVADIKDELSLVKGIGYKIKTRKKIKKVPQLDYIISWKDLLKTCSDDSMPEIEVKSDDVSVILYSGGTTGVPKGVMLTNLNMNATVYATLAISECLPCTVDELFSEEGREKALFRDYSVLSVMPMFHGFGLCVGVHTFLSFGGRCILVPVFTPDSFAKLVVKERPNFVFGVPTLFERMIRSEAMEHADLSCIDGIYSGGDALPPETKEKVDAFIKEHNGKTVVREGYGLTETVAVVCLTPLNNGRRGSIGIPFPDVMFGIFEYGTTNLVPYGQDGEICISGPTVMKGYYNHEEETKDALKVHEDGRVWMHTGDMGMMDEDGFVYFRQRYKRVIISSGYNIYPSQIEAAINRYPGVVESCAIGIPDPIRVQRIKVFVVLEEGVEGNDELVKKLIAYSRENFSRFAVPKDFEFIDKLPRTKVGKIAYRELEELEASRRK